jgi:hypothetical protein
MSKYRVWFNQINQTFIDVEAKSWAKAQEKALKKWREGEGWPTCSYITKDGEEDDVRFTDK